MQKQHYFTHQFIQFSYNFYIISLSLALTLVYESQQFYGQQESIITIFSTFILNIIFLSLNHQPSQQNSSIFYQIKLKSQLFPIIIFSHPSTNKLTRQNYQLSNNNNQLQYTKIINNNYIRTSPKKITDTLNIKKQMNTLTACSFLNNLGNNIQSIDSPLQLKLIKFLGLKNYMIQNLIFKRKITKYCIRKCYHTNKIFLSSVEFQPPNGYLLEIKIIQTSNHSIPICRFIPKNCKNNCAIIYAHGNASDMTDTQNIHTQYIVFDYTGYGQSRVNDVGEQIICKDLQIVLAYISQRIKIKNVIVWGFSLGTYPVVKISSKYRLLGTILQCPIASISCLFHTTLNPDMKFKQDYFANIDYITQIKNKLFIMHSSADQIIPLTHAKVLYQKYIIKHGQEDVDFIQISKIKHNSLHRYIVSGVKNQLQKQLFQWILNRIFDQNKPKDSQQKEDGVKNDRKQQRKRKQIQQAKQRQNQQQAQLNSIRLKIIQADIEEMSGDMYELIIQQNNEKIKNKYLDDKIGKKKNCLFEQCL